MGCKQSVKRKMLRPDQAERGSEPGRRWRGDRSGQTKRAASVASSRQADRSARSRVSVRAFGSCLPTQAEPRHRRAPTWCRGISCRHAAEDMRLGAATRHQTAPAYLRAVDDQGRPLLRPTRKGPEGKAFLREAYTDIPAVVEAMRVAPILDADPLPQGSVTIRYADPHTGYRQIAYQRDRDTENSRSPARVPVRCGTTS
jgi:hypothetical protein